MKPGDLHVEGYTPYGGKSHVFCTCYRCGATVHFYIYAIQLHNRWHDMIEQLTRLDRPDGTTEREQ